MKRDDSIKRDKKGIKIHISLIFTVVFCFSFK